MVFGDAQKALEMKMFGLSVEMGSDPHGKRNKTVVGNVLVTIKKKWIWESRIKLRINK